MSGWPLYQPRGLFMNLFATVVANSLGIARAAIDDFVLLATQEGSTQSSTLLKERGFVQSRVAEAEAILNASRAYMIDALGRAWAAQYAQVADPTHEIAQARLATKQQRRLGGARDRAAKVVKAIDGAAHQSRARADKLAIN
jgi:alkylation response protein AidB-like acyl-CoA dehydrogenase